MPDNVAPMPDGGSRAARRDQASGGSRLSPEERLERVAQRLRQLADEFPQAMVWVEAEVEALRGEVRQALKAIEKAAAAERGELADQVALLRESISAMGRVLVTLRDEVAALGADTRPITRPPSAPGGSGLGLPPRRSASPFPGANPPRRPPA